MMWIKYILLNYIFLFNGHTLPDLPPSENKHSLYYEYTVQSGSFKCTAVTVLDGRQIDSYNSTEGLSTPKEYVLTTLPDWDSGTADLNKYAPWIKYSLKLFIADFGHNFSDVHVLQWRFGCETDATFKVLSCINEFGYDGEDLISYDWTSKQWKASVKQAQVTAEKWNSDRWQNTVFRNCEELIYLKYNNTEIRQSPPVVYAFAKRAINNPGKLTLTFMVTDLYPKDVRMSVRKDRTSVPDYMLTSSGIRPNEDETYQLRMSLNIVENKKADYDCYVTHSSLKEPLIYKWDGKCNNCSEDIILIWVIIGVIFGVIVIVLILKRKGCDNRASTGSSNNYQYQADNGSMHSAFPLLPTTVVSTGQHQGSPGRRPSSPEDKRTANN